MTGSIALLRLLVRGKGLWTLFSAVSLALAVHWIATRLRAQGAADVDGPTDVHALWNRELHAHVAAFGVAMSIGLALAGIGFEVLAAPFAHGLPRLRSTLRGLLLAAAAVAPLAGVAAYASRGGDGASLAASAIASLALAIAVRFADSSRDTRAPAIAVLFAAMFGVPLLLPEIASAVGRWPWLAPIGWGAPLAVALRRLDRDRCRARAMRAERVERDIDDELNRESARDRSRPPFGASRRPRTAWDWSWVALYEHALTPKRIAIGALTSITLVLAVVTIRGEGRLFDLAHQAARLERVLASGDHGGAREDGMPIVAFALGLWMSFWTLFLPFGLRADVHHTLDRRRRAQATWLASVWLGAGALAIGGLALTAVWAGIAWARGSALDAARVPEWIRAWLCATATIPFAQWVRWRWIARTNALRRGMPWLATAWLVPVTLVVVGLTAAWKIEPFERAPLALQFASVGLLIVVSHAAWRRYLHARIASADLA